jgi:anthranilate/para-aminobenzoate synthase component II
VTFASLTATVTASFNQSITIMSLQHQSKKQVAIGFHIDAIDASFTTAIKQTTLNSKELITQAD